MFLTLVYFLIALLLLVVVHEYGHFKVARLCGVKVLRFSFGFGPIIKSWKDKKGTEYLWSLIPLGGYVKMLDESEGAVSTKEKHLAFNNQSLWVRIAIVLAGPLFNFIFAFIALWLVLVIGIYSLAPIIDSVQPNSIAFKAGLTPKQEIVALDDKTVYSWRDFQYLMMPLIGSQKTIKLTLRSIVDGQKKELLLPLVDWKLNNKKPDLLASIGIKAFVPSVPPVIGEVIANSPGEQSGLKKGDEILSVNDSPIKDWMTLVDYVKKRPATKLDLQLKRDGVIQKIEVITGEQRNQGQQEGFLGLRSKQVDWPANWLRLERENPIRAIHAALKQTLYFTKATFILMGRLVTGQLDIKSISGPVGIAQGAGDSGRGGFVSYLFFLALVSISLGTLNLLPIPMLDGGHLLYYVLELMRGKPLSDGVKSIGLYVGFFVLGLLMFIALTNDISRLTGAS